MTECSNQVFRFMVSSRDGMVLYMLESAGIRRLRIGRRRRVLLAREFGGSGLADDEEQLSTLNDSGKHL